MRTFFGAALLLGLCFAPPLWGANTVPVIDSPAGRRAFDDLGLYYKQGTAPDYQSALKQLASSDQNVAADAGEYLQALLAQAFADETNGRASWRALPFWGGGAENKARDFRGTVAGAIGDSASVPAALPAVLWLIDDDMIEDNIAAGARALARIHSPEADAAIGRLLAERHPSRIVLLTALQEAGARHLVQDRAAVVALEQWYRPMIRAAARRAAVQLGETQVAEYDPHGPLPPRMLQFVQNNAQRLMIRVSPDEAWLRVDKTDWPTQGWLTGESFFQWRVVDYFLRDDWVFKRGKSLQASSFSAVVENVIAQRGKITALQNSGNDDDNESFDAIRKREDTMFALSRGGMLTGQFEPGFISMPEVTLSTWCWQRGDVDRCRRLLEPCFDSADDDRWLDAAARDYIGNVYHIRMVWAFCNDQDFPAALALARHLSGPFFDGYSYQSRARELAAQITRQDTDAKISLPSLPVWSILQLCLSREGQINYLARRLKLLHVEQDMQPGDVCYDSAVPYSLAGIYRINPFLELKRMDLGARDLAALAPYINDRDYSLTYSYWRDFNPNRRLHRVSWMVRKLVNDTAGTPVPGSGMKQITLDDGTTPKELLSMADDETVYFTARPAADPATAFKAWADAQPDRGFLARWWQTPAALLITFWIMRGYLKKYSFAKVPLKSIIFIFFLFAVVTPFFNLYLQQGHDRPGVLLYVSRLANEIAKIFLWLFIIRVVLALYRRWFPVIRASLNRLIGGRGAVIEPRA